MAGTTFLIAHGRLTNRVERRFHEEAVKATGKPSPRVAFIGAASGDHPGYIETIRDYFQTTFHSEVAPIYLSRAPMKRSDAESIIAGADVLYFGGGDVSVLVRTVRQAGLEEALRAHHRSGAVAVGVSAGAIGIGPHWIEWPDPPRPDEPEDGATVFPALGLVTDLLCDVHDEAGDWGELRALVRLLEAREKKLKAYGIVGGGALVIGPDGKVRTRGRRSILVADA